MNSVEHTCKTEKVLPKAKHAGVTRRGISEIFCVQSFECNSPSLTERGKGLTKTINEAH